MRIVYDGSHVDIQQVASTISAEKLLEISELLAASLNEGINNEEKQAVLRSFRLSEMEGSYNSMSLVQQPELVQREIPEKLEAIPTRLVTTEEANQRLGGLFRLFNFGEKVISTGGVDKVYSAETDFDFVDAEHNPQGLCLVIKNKQDGNEQSRVVLGLSPIEDNGKIIGWATFSKVTTEKGSKEQFHIGFAKFDRALAAAIN